MASGTSPSLLNDKVPANVAALIVGAHQIELAATLGSRVGGAAEIKSYHSLAQAIIAQRTATISTPGASLARSWGCGKCENPEMGRCL